MIFLTNFGAPATRAKCKLLVVEDDTSSRQALTRILDMLGYEASSAATLSEGMTKLRENPSCVLLDLMLPDGNGMELLESVRQQNLPIRVAVTSGADKPMIAQAQQLRPDAVFKKPIDVTRLIEWLEMA